MNTRDYSDTVIVTVTRALYIMCNTKLVKLTSWDQDLNEITSQIHDSKVAE